MRLLGGEWGLCGALCKCLAENPLFISPDRTKVVQKLDPGQNAVSYDWASGRFCHGGCVLGQISRLTP